MFFAWGLGSPAQGSVTSLTLISDSGDPIGGGRQQFYTVSNGSFGSTWNGNRASVSFNAPFNGPSYYLGFAAPAGQVLAVGSYYDAGGYATADYPGLDISGNGRGCNMVTGSFEVKQVTYGLFNTLLSFWATFEQHCEGVVPALRGSILYNADAQVQVTAPLLKDVEKGQALSFVVTARDADGRHVSLSVSGMPSGAAFSDNGDNTGTFTWMPQFDQGGTYALVFHGEDDLGASDDSTTRIIVSGTTSLLIESDSGDYVGGGQRQFLTPDDGDVSANRNFVNGVSLAFVSDNHRWSLAFSAPLNAPLSVGIYSGAVRYSVVTSNRAGLSVERDGQACYTLSGSFEVKQIVYGPGTAVDEFWATFEQRCEGSTAALRGEVRFKADVPLILRSPSNVYTVENRNLHFQVKALTADAGPITLTATGLPVGAAFTDNGDETGTFDWTPSRGQAGAYSVTLLATNGLGLTDRTFAGIFVALQNDGIDDATAISSLPFSDSFDPGLVTVALDDPFCARTAPSAWYRITPSQTQNLELTLSNSYTTALAVYSGSRGQLTQIACAGGARATFTALAGQTYLIMVTASPVIGPLTFSIDALPPPPVNDDIASATNIATLPFADRLDTRTATTAGTDPSYCLGRGPTVWYRLTVPQDIIIDANTYGSDYSTTLSAYTGSGAALLTPIQCGFNHIIFHAVAGQTYYLMVGSFNDGLGGHLAFSVVGLPPLTMRLTIDPTGVVNKRTGVVTVNGTIVCSLPSTAHVNVGLTQRIGRGLISGSVDFMTECDSQTVWSATLSGGTGQFTGGMADVQVSANAQDSRTGEHVDVQASTTIRLLRRPRKIL